MRHSGSSIAVTGRCIGPADPVTLTPLALSIPANVQAAKSAGFVLAWIDCDLHQVVDAGDHWFVMGAVRDMDVANEGGPLVFFRGGYGRFTI